MNRLEELEQGVRAEVKERHGEDEYPEDTLHEIVDGHIPIYNNAYAELIAEDINLLLDEPEVEAAEWWAPALRIVVGNLYERLYQVAAEELENLEAEVPA